VTLFDQRGQHVNYQYNAAGDINLDSVSNRAHFLEQLRKLQREVEVARQAGVLPDQLAIEAEHQLRRSTAEASKPIPEKASVMGFLTAAKELFEAAAAAGGLVTAATKAIEVASRLF
jgi:hypothetical protein